MVIKKTLSKPLTLNYFDRIPQGLNDCLKLSIYYSSYEVRWRGLNHRDGRNRQ